DGDPRGSQRGRGAEQGEEDQGGVRGGHRRQRGPGGRSPGGQTRRGEHRGPAGRGRGRRQQGGHPAGHRAGRRERRQRRRGPGGQGGLADGGGDGAAAADPLGGHLVGPAFRRVGHRGLQRAQERVRLRGQPHGEQEPVVAVGQV